MLIPPSPVRTIDGIWTLTFPWRIETPTLLIDHTFCDGIGKDPFPLPRPILFTNGMGNMSGTSLFIPTARILWQILSPLYSLGTFFVSILTRTLVCRDTKGIPTAFGITVSRTSVIPFPWTLSTWACTAFFTSFIVLGSRLSFIHALKTLSVLMWRTLHIPILIPS